MLRNIWCARGVLALVPSVYLLCRLCSLFVLPTQFHSDFIAACSATAASFSCLCFLHYLSLCSHRVRTCSLSEHISRGSCSVPWSLLFSRWFSWLLLYLEPVWPSVQILSIVFPTRSSRPCVTGPYPTSIFPCLWCCVCLCLPVGLVLWLIPLSFWLQCNPWYGGASLDFDRVIARVLSSLDFQWSLLSSDLLCMLTLYYTCTPWACLESVLGLNMTF